jgi:hypothetical protein
VRRSVTANIKFILSMGLHTENKTHNAKTPTTPRRQIRHPVPKSTHVIVSMELTIANIEKF